MSSIGHAFKLALRHFESGDLQQAEQVCRQILQVEKEQVHTLQLLGVIAARTGRPALGCDYLREAVRLKPDFAEAHGNLGNILLGMGQFEEAIASYQHVLGLSPNNLAALLNQGLALLQQRKLIDAAAIFRQALQVEPSFVDSQVNLGHALAELGSLDEAQKHLQQALQLKPEHPEAHNNLGEVFSRMGKIEEAISCFQAATRYQPDYAWAHYNLATHWLLAGNWEQGWPEYEWRWKRKDVVARRFPQPRWQGGPLVNQTILLYAEQGRGDTIQFVRYAPLLRDRGAGVLVECQPDLIKLLKSAPGIDQVFPQGAALPAFDVHAPLLSLPGLCGTTPTDMPRDIPYLTADDTCVERWRERLAAFPGLKVGICWQGSALHQKDYLRSVPLEQFLPLARIAGVRLVSLQYGHGTEQLSKLAEQDLILDWLDRAEDRPQVWISMAALIRALDLVVTVDTAVAHLAGALGVPVWVALAFSPDWRWIRQREDSPWYPSMRLFRQPRPGTWNEVFQNVERTLRELVTSS
jgi:Tfp pilus assembly protein PilF